MLSELLRKIDRAMGDAECQLARSKIHVKSDYDPARCIDAATELVTEGQLKDSRGLVIINRSSTFRLSFFERFSFIA